MFSHDCWFLFIWVDNIINVWFIAQQCLVPHCMYLSRRKAEPRDICYRQLQVIVWRKRIIRWGIFSCICPWLVHRMGKVIGHCSWCSCCFCLSLNLLIRIYSNDLAASSISSCSWWYRGQLSFTAWSTLLVQTSTGVSS